MHWWGNHNVVRLYLRAVFNDIHIYEKCIFLSGKTSRRYFVTNKFLSNHLLSDKILWYLYLTSLILYNVFLGLEFDLWVYCLGCISALLIICTLFDASKKFLCFNFCPIVFFPISLSGGFLLSLLRCFFGTYQIFTLTVNECTRSLI